MNKRQQKQLIKKWTNARVYSSGPQWTGTVIKVIPLNSSPFKVKWDYNGECSMENLMTIEPIQDGYRYNGDWPGRVPRPHESE